MLSRLLPAFVLMMPVASGQSPLYGPATGHPKAGDIAPDLVFSQVLSSPIPGSTSPPNLSGHVTVLSFLPDTSDNPEPIAVWNARVDQYAGKHVQFVWITGEERRTLMPALAQHPIKGWVLYDPDGSTAKAYGLDEPLTIFIGPDRKIVGFQVGVMPDVQTLNAVLDRRIVLTRPTPTTMTKFLEKNLVALDSTPARMPKPEDHRPDFAPSYTVHITPSTAIGHGNSSAPDFLALQGYSLKEAIAELYGLNRVRIVLPTSLATAQRYDFAISLPQPESHEEIKERFKQALQEYFHLTVDREVRLANVYVVTHEPGRTPPLEKPSVGPAHKDSSVGFAASAPSDTGPVSLHNLVSFADEGTLNDFCHDLEGTLDRPVVNETHLEGHYRLLVGALDDSNATFLAKLRKQTGLVISPAQRKIKFLKFKTVDGRQPSVAAIQKEPGL